MNTLVRSSTATLSRRSSVDAYEPLDHRPRLGETRSRHGRSSRASSKRKKPDHNNNIYHYSTNNNVNSRSFRNHRAKQRRIFLKSYELATAEKLQRRRRSAESRRLKSLAAKLVKAVVSVVSCLRIGTARRLRSVDCRLDIRASYPLPNVRPVHQK